MKHTVTGILLTIYKRNHDRHVVYCLTEEAYSHYNMVKETIFVPFVKHRLYRARANTRFEYLEMVWENHSTQAAEELQAFYKEIEKGLITHVVGDGDE